MSDEPQSPSPTDPQEVDPIAGTDSTAADNAAVATDQATATPAAETEAVPKVPEFSALREGLGRNEDGTMDRFYDVQVPVWAELGRIEVPLGDLVKLAEGAVLRLNRPVSDPVDIVSQGVRLARGEVIVIDDCFAVRIKEIVAKK